MAFWKKQTPGHKQMYGPVQCSIVVNRGKVDVSSRRLILPTLNMKKPVEKTCKDTADVNIASRQLDPTFGEHATQNSRIGTSSRVLLNLDRPYYGP